MNYSNIVKQIDDEYKARQMYKEKQRENYKDKKSTECQYQNICGERNYIKTSNYK